MMTHVSAGQKLWKWAAAGLLGLFASGAAGAANGYVPVSPTPYPANTIVCIGDSLTGGEKACEKVSSSSFPTNYCPDVFGAGTYKDVFLTYPVYLAKRVGSGYMVENFARGGAETEQMLGLLTPGCPTIKTSMTIGPSAPVVKFDGVGLFVGDTDSNTPQLPLPEPYSVGNCRLVGDLGGLVRVRYGQSSRSDSAFVFVDGPESDVTVPAGAAFTSDASLMCSNAIQVILLGANNGVKNYTTWVNIIKNHVTSGVASGKYVVLSPHATKTCPNLRSDALEADMAGLFGEHYVNLYAELVTNGMARAKAKGYVAAESTADWNSADGLLSADDLHFNDTGKRVLADIVYDKLVSLGYVTGGGDTPSEPPAHVHTWDAGEETQAATATEDGVWTYHCTGCEATKAVAIPATGGGDADGLTLTTPAKGATVTTHHPDMETFIRKDLAGRCAQWRMDATRLSVEQTELTGEEFNALVPCKDPFNPYPITFAWSDGTAPFRVVVKRASDGKVFVDQTNVTKRTAAIYNSLEIGREWIWTVTDATGATGTSRFTTDAQPPRVVNGGKADNMRDFGGWKGLGGKLIRQGIIYRSGHMDGVTETDYNTLYGLLNIRCAIDLRLPKQIPDPRTGYADWIADVVLTNVVHDGYDLMLPSEKNPVPSTRQAFEALAEATSERARVVNCIYGRDRTGGIAGLVLALLGVSEDDIYNDYMCSDARTRERFHGICKMIESLKKDYPADTLAESTAKYFKATGVTDGQIESFRAKMIEGYEAHDHTWGEWETVAAPGVGVAGKKQRYCATCHEKQVQAIPALDLADTATPIAGGWSNAITIAKTSYCVLAYTNTAASYAWTVPDGVTAIDYLVVGGGGAGGSTQGGGGGAGGFLRSSCAVTAGNALRITVGKGGAAGSGRGGNGGDSLIYDDSAGADVVRALGGGGGGALAESGAAGASGGSGGGASAFAAGVTGGAGTSGQGFAGGVGLDGAASGGGAGGGGAGGMGGNVKCYNEAQTSGICGGAGGAGAASDLTGSTIRYAGGGGGGGTSTENSSPTYGELTTDGGFASDGGGAGGTSRMPAKAGTDGLGGGGGGGGAEGLTAGANGGSGIVVIRYAIADSGDTPGGDEPTPSDFQPEWGYSRTLADGSTVLVFTNTTAAMDWKVPEAAAFVRYLVVAGGGGGGMGKTKSGGRAGGGGGAGGLLTGNSYQTAGSTVRITVGLGGPAASATSGAGQNGSNGGDSSFGDIVAAGGGGGSGACDGDGGAKSGGSGGGGTTQAGAAGLSGQGFGGGQGGSGTGNSGGGGGGAGGVGGTVDAAVATGTAYPGGAGGAGVVSDILGADATYACGGAGGGHCVAAVAQAICPGAGGNGYHLTGEKVTTAPSSGCDGVVIVRYGASGGEPPPTGPSVLSPTGGETVRLLNGNQYAYFTMDETQLRAAVRAKCDKYRTANPDSTNDVYKVDATPQPVTLRWQDSTGVCTVEVVRAADNARAAFGTTSGVTFDVYNLEVGCRYRWTVSDAFGASAGEFVTDATAPRIMNGGVVGCVRDLGGWTGLNGCRVRQGRIFRSAQMNKKIGDKDVRRAEEQGVTLVLGEFLSYITDENRETFVDVMRIKTDVDLRQPNPDASMPETNGMTESPLGPDVSWVNCYLSPYYKPSKSQAGSFAAILAPTNHPAAFHCAAGKDRTGTVALFVLGVLGVPEVDILRDCGFVEDDLNGVFENLIDSTKEEYKCDTFAEACRQHFLKIGFTDSQIEEFRTAMLEGYAGGGGPAHEHVWGDWTTNKVAEVGVAGERQRTCACGETETEVIPALPNEGDPTPSDFNPSWGYAKVLSDGSTVLAFTNVTETMDWTVPEGVTNVRYLVVAGGGAGGGRAGGGGGAGGLLAGDALAVTPGGVLAITVGAGGVNTNGCNSSIGADIVAIGGGQGGSSSSSICAGTAGGSGGGSNGYTSSVAPGAGTEGQGFVGGKGYGRPAGGGGGGAGGAGGAAPCYNDRRTGGVGGSGGVGITNDITGAAVAYAGGGGGGGNVAENLAPTNGVAATNGGYAVAGGGQGATDTRAASAGTDGLGGGGGGGSYDNFATGGRGGDGVVILRFVMSGLPPAEENPTVDGQDVEAGTVFTVADSERPITYPTAPEVTGEVGAQQIVFGAVTVDVPRYYTATLADNVVSLALNGFAKPKITDGTTGEEEKEAFVVSDGNVALHLENVYPSLYYTLEKATALGASPDWTDVETKQGAADFETAAGGDSAFYRIVVSDVPQK